MEQVTRLELIWTNALKEVQESNMSKLGSDGKPIYNDKGKVMKGPNYFEPNLNKFIEMKKNYHWIFLGIAFGIIIYLLDKYIFKYKF